MMPRAVVRRWLGSCALSALVLTTSAASAQAPVTLRLDVLAVDRDGQPVRDLRAADFELREGGRVRPIVEARYVAPTDEPRTTVFVVDDLALSVDSVHQVRRALSRFIDDRVGENDRVAIVRTGADSSHPLTYDRKYLRESVARVQYNGLERGRSTSRWDVPREHSALDSVHSLQSVIPSLAQVPGRKSIVLFSDGIAAFASRFADPRIEDALREVATAANRASIVIYTVDGRGLAAPFSRGWSGAYRTFEQGGLAFLAEETGGQFLWNTDVESAVGRLMDAESGYYLLRYDSELSARTRSRSIDVRVNRRGVKARARTHVFAAPSGSSI